MVTTREFICLAAWHLFEDRELFDRYRAADEPERLGLLQEILRLEPVVGRLSRRATAPLRLPTRDGGTTVPPGELITVFVDEANTDPDVVGPDPYLLRPGRALELGPGAAGLPSGTVRTAVRVPPSPYWRRTSCSAGSSRSTACG
ncbi:hypothetical protein ACIBBD_13110 [Streptomyces sp. NPDC051315]|uniref:hypothetical protein n=1 Tax=Streptomyces sp. NPDC051315 TaxID=3365650 RepID=UPI00379D5055